MSSRPPKHLDRSRAAHLALISPMYPRRLKLYLSFNHGRGALLSFLKLLSPKSTQVPLCVVLNAEGEQLLGS